MVDCKYVDNLSLVIISFLMMNSTNSLVDSMIVYYYKQVALLRGKTKVPHIEGRDENLQTEGEV